uniref:Sushi domain-containing protein n=1 Tax=Pavo cristatus TaxID=9049 RepID=A0A8C9F085_PAVCR
MALPSSPRCVELSAPRHCQWEAQRPRHGSVCLLSMPLCPSPPVIDHGQHDGRDMEFIPGMSVNYSCDPGYSLTGKEALYCTDNASWSSPQPPRTKGRGLQQPLSGTEDSLPAHTLDAVLTLVALCMHPSCTLSHLCSFSDFFPLFLVLQCPSPPNIHGGNHDSQDVEVFLPGMAVNYSCDPGYSLMGEASIYCTESGNWSLPTPQCEEVVCPVPQIQNGRVSIPKQRYRYKDTVSFQCHEGFVLKGHSTAQCKADRTWHPPCLPPPSITNGEHSNFSDTFGVGAVVHYRCKPGFFLTGSESIRCTPHGVWSRPLPQCEGTFTLLSSVLIFLNVLSMW